MNDLIEQFIKLPRAQKIGLVAGLYVLVAGLYIYLGYMPLTEELEGLQTQQQTLTAEKDKTQQIADNLDRFKVEVESLNEDLNKALKELPNNREIDKLLKRVSTIGKKIGLEFLLFQPLPEVVEGFYAQVPVKIEVSGSFHEIAMFFDRIGKLSRIVNINDIQMSGPQERGGKIILKTSGKATTYRFIDVEEGAVKKEGEKPKETKGGEE
jgi:type IV pilus assembly protein PilO